jgi:hypothetical protein
VKEAERLLERTGGLVTIEVSGAPPSTTWRTVRTTVPVVASRCCSQSSSAVKVLGLTQPSLQRVAQMPWKVS